MSISQDRDDLLGVAQRNEELMSVAQRYRDEQKAAAPTPSELIQTNIGGSAGFVARGGTATTVSSKGQASATAGNPGLPPGMIRLANGMETTVEAAKAAGLISGDFNAGPAVAPSTGPNNFQGQPAETPAATLKSEPSSAELPEGTTTEEASKIELAAAAVYRGHEVIGEYATQSMMQEVVASGELPRELPDGIHSDMVTAAVDGYRAQANSVLRETGATVEALEALLNHNELREARLATFTDNRVKLRELGGKAIERLARLPNDPALFQQLTAGWPEEVKLTRKGGTMYVKAPEWERELTWAAAVSAGKISY